MLFLWACVADQAPVEARWYAESVECEYEDEVYAAEWNVPADAIFVLASTAGTGQAVDTFDSGEPFGVPVETSSPREALVIGGWDGTVSVTCGDGTDAWTFLYAVAD